MNPQRILFVDDEAPLLESLQHTLRPQRTRWDMVFAVGGEAALAELKKARFDVVVSDMRMPGMDGAELLKRVKAQHPATARIMLAGLTDRTAMRRSAPVAHQYLTKPCNEAALRTALERTCGVQALLYNSSLRAMVSDVASLPSVPMTYFELCSVIADPAAALSDVAKVIEKDPAMATKVLQLVNSAYFGIAQPMTSVASAVRYLGLEQIKAIALSTHFLNIAKATSVEGLAADELQASAMLTARVARSLLSSVEQSQQAFTAALVRDVGLLVLASQQPQRFTAISRLAHESGRSFESIEREQLGVTHAELGAYLLGLWGLPFAIVEAVAFHHRPSSLVDGELSVVAAVHTAGVLVDEARGIAGASALDEDFLRRAGVLDALDRWRAVAVAAVEGAEPKHPARSSARAAATRSS